ncbi:hypothetical protein M493_02625 [Geobacillus genomosp. 3]|uniref:DUF4367 domain-containing protein n=1 Tax=Geobacillus genomosp. 3 TaxID=1921421 RepID=S5ZKK8_GEOG3|nr:hypothetical protein [Geobacillus genomosp. 3]AGT30858.1 hypothetical protein M493_02625 [Geobacillus genomosp. 3]
MDERKWDEMIQTALLYGTDEAAEQKEDVWVHIRSRMVKQRRKRRRTGKRGWMAVSAAAAVALAFLFTAPGQAAIDQVKQWFAPKKVITEEIEGQKEQKEVTLNEGKAGYVIYVDESMYRMETRNGHDRIVPLHQGGSDIPPVYMEIRQVTDRSPETVAAELEQEVKEKYPVIIQTGKVKEPVTGYVIHGEAGYKWNDEVVKYYVVPNGKGGAFIIEQRYFLEASEGHGARFDYMVRQFHIVDKQEAE